MKPLPKSLNKILIWSADRIGESVMTTPAVRTVRENYPEAEITLLGTPRVHDIFQFSPRIDQLLIYEKDGEHSGVRGFFQLVRDLRQHSFEAVVLLSPRLMPALVARLAGIPIRAGVVASGRGPLLTHGVHEPLAVVKKHKVDMYMRQMLSLGMRSGSYDLELYLFGDQIDAMKARVGSLADIRVGEQPLVGFIPGATYAPSKRWPVERYAELAQLICRDPQARIILFGSKAERANCSDIIAKSGTAATNMLNMAGTARLIETIALLCECDVLVTSDSGLMHAATALQVPLVALFGATDPQCSGPYSDNAVVIHKPVPCSPCNKPRCPKKHLQCMKLITSADVHREVASFLADR